MRRTRTAGRCFLLGILLLASAAVAGPNLISYQGLLHDSGGSPLSGSYSLTFRIYSVAAGGTALWTETQTVGVSNGVFNVQLGAVTPLASALFATDTLYLGVQVGADQEMTPRQRITAGAYAMRAAIHAPIGSIMAWAKSMPGVPPLDGTWIECNGQTIVDPESPLNGQVVPNLNGEAGGRFLRGGTSSGTTGGSETHGHQWYHYDFSVIQSGSQTIPKVNHTRETYSWDQNGNPKSIADNETEIRTSYFTSKTDSAPAYYSVVWIMRVK